MLIKLNNLGDTMIEVMMCLVIAGLVFGGAYTTARRSTNGVSTSGERISALKIAETQAELIRDQQVARFGATFCFDSSNTMLTVPSCTIDSFYSATITPPSSNPTPANGIQTFNYKIEVIWPSLSGGKNKVTLLYSYAK